MMGVGRRRGAPDAAGRPAAAPGARRGRRTAAGWTGGLVCLLACLACGSGREAEPSGPRLSPQHLLGRTPQQMVAHLGRPQSQRDEVSGHYGFLRWPDVDGVSVMAIVSGGKGVYVSYQFSPEDPFDEEVAFARLGLEIPDEPPAPLSDRGAKRWHPFGPYERLTVNPETRLIAIGSYPLR